MKTLGIILLTLAALFFALQIVGRLLKKKYPSPCPWWFAGILENPLRRRFASPRKTLEQIGLIEGMTVLEVGPGPGLLTVEAAQRLGSSGKLYSLDIQSQMLRMVRQKLQRQALDNVALLLGDATALPLQDNSLDLAFLVYVLGEIPDGDKALSELSRCLKPGGRLSIAEVLPDPDYSTASSVIKRARLAGFEPIEQKGNFLNYTVNFRKRYNFNNLSPSSSPFPQGRGRKDKIRGTPPYPPAKGKNSLWTSFSRGAGCFLPSFPFGKDRGIPPKVKLSEAVRNCHSRPGRESRLKNLASILDSSLRWNDKRTQENGVFKQPH